MSDYTPSEEDLREAWIGQQVLSVSARGQAAPDDEGIFQAEFDRALARIKAEAKAEALEEAAKIARTYDSGYDPTPITIAESLEDRAAEYRKATQ